MLRWLLVIVTVISSGGLTAFAADDRPRAFAVLATKQAELDRLAKEVAELEQQLDRPTQALIQFQMLSVSRADWETLNPADDAAEESRAVSRDWLVRLQTLRRLKQVQELLNPAVLARNGKPARSSNGGEFPIPVPAPGTQPAGTMTIQWREFGDIVEVVPVIKGDGRIDLQLSAEHSLRDLNTAVKINDVKVPGLMKTRFSSRVQARFGETMFVARGQHNDRMIFLLVTPERVK